MSSPQGRLCIRAERGYAHAIEALSAAACAAVTPRLVQLPGTVGLSVARPRSAAPVGVWWANDSTADTAVPNASAFPSWQLAPRPPDAHRRCTHASTLRRPVVGLFSFFAGNYGHSLHDWLPLVAWVRGALPGSALLLPASASLRATLDHVDRGYASGRVVWLREGSAACAASARVVVVPRSRRGDRQLNFAWVRKAAFATALRSSWLVPTGAVKPLGNGTVILYDRGGRTVQHGRGMTRQHVHSIAAVARRAMRVFRRGEALVRYDGALHASTAMPVARQAALFGGADAVIGPHGAGMANVLWLPVRTRHGRPGVLEFVCGQRSAAVQRGCPYARSHWALFATAPWVRWHHQFFTPNSTPSVTWIDLRELSASLRCMWAPKRRRRVPDAGTTSAPARVCGSAHLFERV